MPQQQVHPFGPLFRQDSRILILGSFPSVKSREALFFYGHPQNRFWKMLAGVFGASVPQTVEEKTKLVLSHQLAMWDTIHSCTIEGSADSSIRDVVPNEIAWLVSQTQVQKILCNGTASFQFYTKYVSPKPDLPVKKMPSTSPANAAVSLDKLIALWGPELMEAEPI